MVFNYPLTTDFWQHLPKHPEYKPVTHSFIFFFLLAASCSGVIWCGTTGLLSERAPLTHHCCLLLRPWKQLDNVSFGSRRWCHRRSSHFNGAALAGLWREATLYFRCSAGFEPDAAVVRGGVSLPRCPAPFVLRRGAANSTPLRCMRQKHEAIF